MRFPATLLIAAVLVTASFGTAGAQVGGQVYSVNLSTAVAPTADCYHFDGAAAATTGDFSSDLRDPTVALPNTENWTSMGAFLTSYLFAGETDLGVAWGGSGLVLLNFLLFNGQEIDENGVGVGYAVSGIVNAACVIVPPGVPPAIAGVAPPLPE